MATEYDLKLVVDADTTEAQRKLDELAAAQSSSPEVQEAAQRVREFFAPAPERTQPSPRQQPQPPAPPQTRTDPRPQPQPSAPQPARLQQRPQPQPSAPQPARPEPRPQPPAPQSERPEPRPDPRPQPQPPAQPPAPQPPSQPQIVPPAITPQVHSPAAQSAADRVSWSLPKNNKPNLSNNPEDFGKKAGDVAGRAIGKAVAGFLAHEVATTIFNGLKTPGGDNRGVNQAEAGVGGALKYGTMGAMIGGPLGAIIGGVGGAIMGGYQERQRQQKAVEARDNELQNSLYRRIVDTAMSASDSAFGKSLDLAGSSRLRQEMIRSRRDEIESGSGSFSIKNLEKALKNLDPESDKGRRVAANIEMQRSRVAALDQQLLDEGLSVAPNRLDPASVADSWAKRGVQVGAQVDVAQVNEKIMGEVQSCRALLEKIANMTNGDSISIRNMLKAVYD